MAIKTIEFSKAVSFSENIATGAVVTGPSRDGMVHLMFTRETQTPVSFDAEIEHETTSIGAAERVKDSGAPRVEFGRQLVTTVIVPLSGAEKIQEALTKLIDFAKTQSVKEDQ